MPRPRLTEDQRCRALALMWKAYRRLGQKALVADLLGINRSAASMVMDCTYPANPDAVLAKALSMLDRIACPYLGAEVESAHCHDVNSGPVPTWDPGALSNRRACQACPHKPAGGPLAGRKETP